MSCEICNKSCSSSTGESASGQRNGLASESRNFRGKGKENIMTFSIFTHKSRQIRLEI